MSDRLPNAIDRHVASRLRLRRLEAGLSQTTLAAALGVTFQQLQKYEGAINRISAGALYQLALALDVPVQYFFRWSEQTRQAAPIAIRSGAQPGRVTIVSGEKEAR